MCAKKKKHGKEKASLFVLVGSHRTYYRGKTQANFTPVASVSIIPKFNLDRLYYTPSFMIPLVYGQKKEAQYLASMQEKAKNNEQISASKILMPKPRSKSKYCSICHSYFEDYKIHVESVQHKEQFHKATFQQHIEKLCHRYSSRSGYQTISEQGSCYKQETIKSETFAIDDNNII